jgi:hypothetical protein
MFRAASYGDAFKDDVGRILDLDGVRSRAAHVDCRSRSLGWRVPNPSVRVAFRADPIFVDLASGDFRLRPGSPAIGRGPNGTNIGAGKMEESRWLGDGKR